MTPQEQLRLLRASRDEAMPASKRLQIMRAMKSGEGSVDDILGRPASSLGRAKAPKFSDLQGKDEQMFDYTTGAGGGLRAKLSFMETDEERQNFLRQRVGGAHAGPHTALRRA